MKVLPVIHLQNTSQDLENLKIAIYTGCDGAFIISMDGDDEAATQFAASARHLTAPNFKIGLNCLGLSPIEAARIGVARNLDMTWHDQDILRAGTHGLQKLIGETEHEFYASFAFKGQPKTANPQGTCLTLREMGMIPTTSGPGTGKAADESKIEDLWMIQKEAGLEPLLALASGLTPDNIHKFAPYISHALVNTGISKSFYEFDADLLSEFVQYCRNY